MSTPQDQLRNLLCYQRKNINDIGLYGRLDFEDMKRIDRLICGDPIKDSSCCIFLGKKKNKYCCFSYRGKKTSVLRLLYHNLVDDIKPDHKIIHTCENKTICCNINHFYMLEKENDEEISDFEEMSDSERNNEADQEIFQFSDEV